MAEGPDWGWAVAGVTSLITLYKMLAERDKLGADAGEAISRAALQLVQPLEKRVVALEAERTALEQRVSEQARQIAELRCRVSGFANGVARLQQQIVEAGMTPVWTGDPVESDG